MLTDFEPQFRLVLIDLKRLFQLEMVYLSSDNVAGKLDWIIFSLI